MSDSIWKKEISFKRKPKGDADPEAFELPAAPEKQSFLKKEISFSRKTKEPKAAKEPKAPKEATAEKQSFLKKEISFSRKPKDPVEPSAPKESIWKKDLSGGRASKADRKLEQLVQEATRAVEAVPLPPSLQETLQTVDAPPPLPPTELAEAVVAAMPDPIAPEPVPVLPVESVAPVVELPLEPAPAWPEPVVEPAAAEPWLAQPELPPAPAAPEPVVVHPPVPAAELPPLEPEVKTPFWKKDVSFSRKPKAPKAPKEPKPAGQSFLKKELSFSRKKAKTPAAAEAPTEQLPATPGVPVWKRQVSLSMPKLSLPKLALPGRSAGDAKGGGGSHRAKRIVGLKIGASQLAAARVSNNGVAELQQVARTPLAPGVVVGGELRDPEALGDALKAFFAKYKLPKKGVRLGIASNRIGVRIIDIAGIAEDKQLANAVQFRAQEALPIPLDEAVLDYRVLEESVDAEGQSVKRVLLVVVYRELIERYVSACRKAGIHLAGIDLEAFALLRALGAPSDRGGSALVAVAIGHDRSTFAVSDGRNCEFTRVVDWGGSALNVALARALNSTPSEVEAFKRGISLDGSTQPEGLNADQSAAALDAVRKQVQSFARELVSSLQFYQNQPGSLGIGEIVVTGGTAQLPGLAEELERLIGVPVRMGDPFARMKLAKKVGKTEQVGSLAVAIGLGIED